MGSEPNTIRRYAMLLGTYMGVFWILKFALVPLGLTTSFLMMLFLGLTICVPFMGYRYVRLYRDRVCGGSIGFGRAWLFTTLMYIFAALLTAMAHYAYFAWLDHGYFLDTVETIWDQAATTGLDEVESYAEAVHEALALARLMSPVDIVMQLLWQNVFYCALLAVPTALIVQRK